MKIILSTITFIFLTIGLSLAQIKIKPLRVGDTITDVAIKQMLFYKTPTARISDFKGKLLVLDFWATYCIPCIQELPRFDSLQRQFNDKIQVLPVTFQKKEVIVPFIKRLPSLKNLNLPIAVSDTILGELFPHISVPHDIIIDQRGIVKAIVNSRSINMESIQSILNGENTKMISKGTDNLNFDVEEPFFLDSIGRKILLTYQMIARHYNGLSQTRSSRRRHDGQLSDYRVMGTNMMLLNMYRVALMKRLASSGEIPNNRINLMVKDLQRFYPPDSLNPDGKLIWEKKNTYCYDFIIPDSSGIDVYSLFKENLDRYFHTKSKLDTKLVDCFIIKNIDSTKYLSKSKNLVNDLGKELWSFRNDSFYDIFRRLTPKLNYNIVDETNFNGRADLEIRPVFNDPESLKADLNRQGLDLVKEKRELQFITIEDQ